jgi:hypothetical protein
MATCPPVLVEAPALMPYRYGLFSVAAMPQEPPDNSWECGGIRYVTHGCARAHIWVDDCESPPDKPVQAAQSLVGGDPFVVLAGPQCDLIGSSLDEIQVSATEALRLGEQRAVEEYLWSRLAACCDSPGEESPGEENTCCVDGSPCCAVLNPTEEALSITGGLAALEEYAGEHYGGVPVIHSPRGLAAYAGAANLLCVCDSGQMKETVLGSRWAFYGASLNTGPCNTPAPAGTAWMYITGAVTVRRSPVFLTPPNPRDGFDYRHNTATVIAERLYAVTYECACAAVLVSASCQC